MKTSAIIVDKTTNKPAFDEIVALRSVTRKFRGPHAPAPAETTVRHKSKTN